MDHGTADHEDRRGALPRAIHRRGNRHSGADHGRGCYSHSLDTGTGVYDTYDYPGGTAHIKRDTHLHTLAKEILGIATRRVNNR